MMASETKLHFEPECSICGGTGTTFGKRCVCSMTDTGSQVHPRMARPHIPFGVSSHVAQVPAAAASVDSVQFHPRLGPPATIGPAGFMHDGAYIIGSVGRMDHTANHATLVEAFLHLIASPHAAHQRVRLVIIGEGPCRAECQAMLDRAGAAHRAWLPGERANIPQLLRSMDLFVLPSIAEARPGTLLEAMSTGLPVIATTVGANTELVQPGLTGILVPPKSAELMAAAMSDYCRIPQIGARHGARARSRVIARYSLTEIERLNRAACAPQVLSR